MYPWAKLIFSCFKVLWCPHVCEMEMTATVHQKDTRVLQQRDCPPPPYFSHSSDPMGTSGIICYPTLEQPTKNIVVYRENMSISWYKMTVKTKINKEIILIFYKYDSQKIH